MKKTFLASLLTFSLFLTLGAVLVYAQTGRDSNPLPTDHDSNPSVGVRFSIDNPFNCGGVSPCTLFSFLRSIIDNIILPIGGVLAVLAFIFSGFLYVMAQGNETKLKTAHNALLYTAIGTAILLGSWVLAKVIETTVNQLRT
jgi:predicted permease